MRKPPARDRTGWASFRRTPAGLTASKPQAQAPGTARKRPPPPLREQIESLSRFTVLALRAFSHDFVNQASKPDVPRLAIEPLMPELGDFHSLEPKWTVGNFKA